MSEYLKPVTEEEDEALTPTRRRKHMPMLRLQSIQEEIRLACLKGNLTSLELLIKGNKECINDLFEDGWSPLMIATNTANPPLVKFLLTMGANPNKQRPDGFSPLMTALTSSKGRVLVQQCAELLVDAGADVNCRAEDGLTPLLLAVKDNRVPVVDMLVFNGADVSVKDCNGRSMSQMAAERNFDKIVQTLSKHENDRSQTDKVNSPFYDTATLQTPNTSNPVVNDGSETVSKEHSAGDSSKINMSNSSNGIGNMNNSLQKEKSESIGTVETQLCSEIDSTKSENNSLALGKEYSRTKSAIDTSLSTQPSGNKSGSRSSFMMKAGIAVGIIVFAIGVYFSKLYFQKE